jgi:hypothetical protein
MFREKQDQGLLVSLRCPYRRGGLLFGRHRFTGQCRLLNEEVARFQKLSVRGNQIPRREPYQIARDDFTAFDFPPLTITHDSCRQADVFAQLFDGPLRTVSLAKVDGHAQQDQDDDDSGIHSFSQEC